jgi:hypothetical protein
LKAPEFNDEVTNSSRSQQFERYPSAEGIFSRSEPFMLLFGTNVVVQEIYELGDVARALLELAEPKSSFPVLDGPRTQLKGQAKLLLRQPQLLPDSRNVNHWLGGSLELQDVRNLVGFETQVRVLLTHLAEYHPPFSGSLRSAGRRVQDQDFTAALRNGAKHPLKSFGGFAARKVHQETPVQRGWLQIPKLNRSWNSAEATGKPHRRSLDRRLCQKKKVVHGCTHT